MESFDMEAPVKHPSGNKDTLPVQETIAKIFKKLKFVAGWTQEKTHESATQFRNIIKDREKMVQLSLKNNELARDNSLLQIENDK